MVQPLARPRDIGNSGCECIAPPGLAARAKETRTKPRQNRCGEVRPRPVVLNPGALPLCPMKNKKSRTRKAHELLSVPEAADYLGISSRSVRRHVDNGDLEHRRVGWLIKFDQESLDAFAPPIGGNKKGRKP